MNSHQARTMTSTKRGFRLNVYVVLVLLFSVLIAFLLQRPGQMLSRTSLTVSLEDPRKEKNEPAERNVTGVQRNGELGHNKVEDETAPASVEHLEVNEKQGEIQEASNKESVENVEAAAEQSIQIESAEPLRQTDTDGDLARNDYNVSLSNGTMETEVEHVGDPTNASGERSSEFSEGTEDLEAVSDVEDEAKLKAEVEPRIRDATVSKAETFKAEQAQRPGIEKLGAADEKGASELAVDDLGTDEEVQETGTSAKVDPIGEASIKNGTFTNDTHQSEPKSSKDVEELEEMKSLLKRADTKWKRDSTKMEDGNSSLPTDRQEINTLAVELPPRLEQTLSHLKRSPSLTEPYEWKRPMVLSALGLTSGDKLKIAIFATGINLYGFKRTFNVAGCLVGNKTYPRLTEEYRGPHYCMIDSNVPKGALLSLLLVRDEKLEGAIAKPFVFSNFTFEVREEDLLKLHENITIDSTLRDLADGYEIVGVKSNITWHEGLREPEFNPEKKRYGLCLMTAMRQYPFLMQQWFDYYRRLGVDQIYVYDNVSPEALSRFDSDFVQTGFWPYGRSQYQSFNHFLLLSRNRCKYVGFWDGDEYAFIGDTGPDAMKRYVAKRIGQGYDQVLFPFVVMAGNGYIERPEGFLPNLYPRRSLKQKKYNVGKTIISTDSSYERHAIHYAKGGKKKYQNITFELNPTSLDHNAMLVHYTTRSWEEVMLKKNVGGASVVTSARAPKNFSMENVPKYHLSNDSSVEYLTFRNQWRTIMEVEEPKSVMLVWRRGEEECKQQYCIACSRKTLGEPECNPV